MVNQKGRKQDEQIDNGKYEQPVSRPAIESGASVDSTRKQKETRAAYSGDRAICRTDETKRPRRARSENQENAIDQDLPRCCGAPGDNRQHRYACTRIVTSAIERESPEVRWRPKEDNEKQRQRLEADLSGRSSPSDHGR